MPSPVCDGTLVVRTLEIISEASRRLSPEVKARHAEVPWSSIAGAGNVYRHDYDDVVAERVYYTATSEIVSLVAALVAEGFLEPDDI